MQIKIQAGEGGTSVAVVNPSTNEVVATASVKTGEQVVVTAVNAHEASDIEVGEVSPVEAEEAPPTDGEGEVAAEGGETPAGEGEDCGEGESA